MNNQKGDIQSPKELDIQDTDILTMNDIPFATYESAATTLSTRELGNKYKVHQCDENNFVLRLKTLSEKKEELKDGPDEIQKIDKTELIKSQKTETKEKVFWVIIKPAQNNTATNARYCMPGVNGEMLLLKRGNKYPLPERFLNAIDATLQTASRFALGNDRMDTFLVKTDDYQVVSEATWDDYLKWAAETNRGANDL